MKLTRAVVERLAEQSPCLCGDIDTWHQACYAGKSEQQIRDGYKVAYDIARRKLRERFALKASTAIVNAGATHD